LLLDIDNFKRINDSYGHAAGDLVLKRLTQELTACLKRETDWCARLGGDEFVVVLEGVRLANASVCAENVRRALGNVSIDTPLGAVCFTVSIGVGGLEELANRESATVQSVLERADTYLYASKARGRNRITSADAIDQMARTCVHQRVPYVPKAALSSVR
jgi:diguanylate cyclase (GGDEF)-like protein